MDKITSVKSHVNLSHWAQLIGECQNSGLTVKDWCGNNGVSKDQYYYWLRKVRETSLAGFSAGSSANTQLQSEKAVSFQKLSVSVPACIPKASVTIHLPEATLEIAEGTSQQTVEAVLRALHAL